MATKRNTAAAADQSFFTRRNWQWLIAGAVVIIAGFISLSLGSITLAPLLLVVGYCVLIPIGILVGPSKSDSSPQVTETTDQ
jgi:uncharacterized membrane protein HdeD (DUF308 family)